MNIDESFDKVGKLKSNESYLISHKIGVGRIRLQELQVQ